MARTQTADLLKGIAALLMIQVHIIELFASESIFKSDIGKILLFLGGPPVAPVFLLFLGYFIASSQKTTKHLVIRGIKIIALGLALNIALNLNLLIAVAKGEYPYINILDYIFGVDVLLNAGLSIIIIALLKKVLDKHFVLSLLFAFAVSFLGIFLLDNTTKPDDKALLYFLAFIYGDSTWSYFPLFPWLSYSLAGIALYKLSIQYDFSILDSLKAKIILTLLFLLFFAFTYQYAISTASNLQSYYHHGVVFFCWTITFLFFYGLLVKGLEKISQNQPVMKYLRWLGKNITVIYVIQWVIIGNIATEIYRTITSPLVLITAFVAITVSSSSLCYLWIRIKKRHMDKPLS